MWTGMLSRFASVRKYGLGLAFGLGTDYILSKLSEQRLHDSIVKKFRMGTKIEMPHLPYYCYREETERLHKVFHNRERKARRKGTFTVIVGPIGCGKTFIVWKAIDKNPKV